MLTRFPDVNVGGFELARSSYQIGDPAEARRAGGEPPRRSPGHAGTLAPIADIDSLCRSRNGSLGE